MNTLHQRQPPSARLTRILNEASAFVMAVIVASAVRLALQLRTRDLRLLLKRELVIAIAPLLAVPLVAWLVNTKLKNNRFLRLMEKDQALVAYQEATGQKDRQDAVRALEQHNWNLEVCEMLVLVVSKKKSSPCSRLP